MFGKCLLLLVVSISFVECAIGSLRRKKTTHPEQVHISLGEKIDEMTVMWSTFRPANTVVEYGLDSEHLERRTNGTWRVLHNRGRNQYVHTTHLSGLEPDTRYFYRCGDGDKDWSDKYSFRTVKKGEDWQPRVAIFGDLGLNKPAAAVRLKDEALSDSIDLIIHDGDIAYDLHTSNGRVGDEYMKMIEPIAARIPYMVSVGNHEAFNWNYTNYRIRYDMPGTEDNLWYSFKYGPIHFVMVSTEVYFFLWYGGISQVYNHYKWMQDTLAQANLPENRARWPWVIVVGHRPMYCSNAALRYCRTDLNPVRNGLFLSYGMEDLIFKYGVDVAFWGHNHCYERLWPTYDGKVYNGSTKHPYVNPKAPVHITTGAAGNQEGETIFSGIKQAWSAFGTLEKSYTKMQALNSTHLHVQQLSAVEKGRVIDSIMIVKDRHGSYFKLFPGYRKPRSRKLIKLLELFSET